MLEAKKRHEIDISIQEKYKQMLKNEEEERRRSFIIERAMRKTNIFKNKMAVEYQNKLKRDRTIKEKNVQLL